MMASSNRCASRWALLAPIMPIIGVLVAGSLASAETMSECQDRERSREKGRARSPTVSGARVGPTATAPRADVVP
jgi:hypothetical protein